MSRVSHERRRVVAAIVAALLAATGCGAHASLQAHDTAQVEILRIQISKVRHAIEETRETIAGSQGASYLPELYLRLAELLSEEARYHYRVALEREQAAGESIHVPQVRLLKEQAIGVYRQMLRRFPDSRMTPQVLFNIGQEQRELGNFDEMRESFETLANEHPDSPLRYEALLLLGDYHFDRNELEPARGFYEQITAGPLTRVTDLAHWKLGWVWVNLGDCPKALVEFERALEAAQQRVQSESDRPEESAEGDEGAAEAGGAEGARGEDEAPAEAEADVSGTDDSIDVRRTALVDLVYCYTEERPLDAAVPYLRERAYDRSTYVAALERMARRLGVLEAGPAVLPVVRELLRLGPAGEDRLEDARQLHTALRAVRDFTQIGADSELLVSALVRYWTHVNITAEARTQLSNEFEVYLRDLLTRSQERLESAPEARRVADARELVRGYRAYVDTFPGSEESVPMLLNMADVASTAGMHFEAGQRSLQAARMLDAGEERRDALYDAVARYQAALQEETSPEHRERVLARAALRSAAMDLLRFQLDDEQQRRVKFAIAESYYDEGMYRQAIDLLTAVAHEYPRTEEANAAVQLVLDSYNTLNDYEGLMQSGRRFLAAGSPASESTRAEIQPVVAAAEQRMLDEVSLEAAGDEGGDLSPLVRFAEQHAGSELGERALQNAFVAARAVGDTELLYRLGGEFARGYPNSDQLPGMLATLGQMAVSRFEVEQAVDFLRQAASTNSEQRVTLLVGAGELHEELGDLETAKDRYLEAMRGTDPRARVVPLEHLARLLERMGDFRTMLTILGATAEDGNTEVLSRLGIAQIAAEDTESAERTLQTVLGAGTSASPGALARAHYGMAEILLRTLDQYPRLENTDLIEEFVTIVDVVQQSYLNAARQGSAEYTPAALGRLAFMARNAAGRLRGANLPSDLPADARRAVREAIDARVRQLEQTATEALTACGQQAFNLGSWGPTSRRCLSNEPPEFTLVEFDRIRPRRQRPAPRGIEPLKERLARNAEDLEALRELGRAFLAGGDAHLARLAFAAASERGGGPIERNLLGIASYRVGDTGGALAAFAQAAEAGLEAGRQNMAAVLGELGFSDAARMALERYPRGRPGGELLGGRRGGSR